MPKVSSRDDIIANIARDVRAVATGRTDRIPLKFFVSNSHDTTGRGLHWATVALSIEPVGERVHTAVMDLTMDSDDEDCEDAAELADLDWGEDEGALGDEMPLFHDEEMEDELLGVKLPCMASLNHPAAEGALDDEMPQLDDEAMEDEMGLHA